MVKIITNNDALMGNWIIFHGNR